MLISVNFRGQEIDVEFRHAHFDPDVGYSELDWDFFEAPNPPATNEEIASIETQLWKKYEGGCLDPDPMDQY